jgi:hypothetical protein
MFAATAHPLPLTSRFTRARASLRLDVAAVALGVCLPIPLLAATGLSLPLPSSVERLAAALVPWVDSAPLDASRAARGESGSITELPGERSRSPFAPRSESAVRSSKPGTQTGGSTSAHNERPAGNRPAVTTPARPVTKPADQTAPPGQPKHEEPAAGTTTDPPTAERPLNPPAPPPPPVVQEPVNKVNETIRPIVDEVKPIVGGVTQPVTEISKPVEVVKGVIPGGGK